MFEDTKEHVVPSQDPLCHSFSKNTVIGDSETDDIAEYILKEKHYNSIKDELVDDAILELCFEVHREAKLNSSIPATFTEITQANGKKVKSNESIICYSCGNNKGPHNFTTHLYDCMLNSEGSIVDSRKAKTKLINFKEWDSDEDSDEYDTDSSKKVQRNKKTVKGKSNSLGNARSYLDMSFGEKKAFFDQKCGSFTKRSKKLCSNSKKCSIHTEEQRASVRQDLLRAEADNGQINVDTIDTSDINMSYDGSDENICDYPSGSFPYF